MKDKNYMKQVGSKIRKGRQAMGISIENLAAKSNITFGCLSEIEHGRADARICTLKSIAEGLNLDLKDLL